MSPRKKKTEKKAKLPKRTVTRFLKPNTPSRGHQQPAQRPSPIQADVLNSTMPVT